MSSSPAKVWPEGVDMILPGGSALAVLPDHCLSVYAVYLRNCSTCMKELQAIFRPQEGMFDPSCDPRPGPYSRYVNNFDFWLLPSITVLVHCNAICYPAFSQLSLSCTVRTTSRLAAAAAECIGDSPPCLSGPFRRCSSVQCFVCCTKQIHPF